MRGGLNSKWDTHILHARHTFSVHPPGYVHLRAVDRVWHILTFLHVVGVRRAAKGISSSESTYWGEGGLTGTTRTGTARTGTGRTGGTRARSGFEYNCW